MLPWKCNNEYSLYHCAILHLWWICFQQHIKSPIFLLDFNQIWILLTNCHSGIQYEISQKFTQWELSWCRQTDKANRHFSWVCEHAWKVIRQYWKKIIQIMSQRTEASLTDNKVMQIWEKRPTGKTGLDSQID